MENATLLSPEEQKVAAPVTSGLSELETHYPRIVEKIVSMWSLPEGERYLYELSIDVRGGREGFSQDVIAEILCLFNVKVEQRGDIWQFWIPDNPYYEELNTRFGKSRPVDVF
jgi:hypothetical protein